MPERRLPEALAPLETPIFRWVWMAAMVSNLGTWMQNVGAAWLMVSLSHSPLLIALVQTATTLPVFLLGVPAGVVADRADRRKLLLWTQSWMLLAAAVLGALTLAGRTGPLTLLALTFALGLGSTMNGPAWQATVPQLVPRKHLAAAVTLNSVQFNIARSLGPALGGLVVALWGPGFAFLFNAVSFLAVIVVLYSWRNVERVDEQPGETMLAAAKTGARYVWQSRVLRSLMARTFVFVFCGSAIWALLPAVAAHLIGSGSGGYGILLGCLGAGAVCAAIGFTRLRGVLKAEQILLTGTVLYAAATLGLGTLYRFEYLCFAMIAGGLAWMGTMSTFNVTAQLALPGWVRARALSIYIFTFQAGLALGSWAWGELAVHIGTRSALIVASAGLIAGLLTSRWFRLGTGEPDPEPA